MNTDHVNFRRLVSKICGMYSHVHIINQQHHANKSNFSVKKSMRKGQLKSIESISKD